MVLIRQLRTEATLGALMRFGTAHTKRTKIVKFAVATATLIFSVAGRFRWLVCRPARVSRLKPNC